MAKSELEHSATWRETPVSSREFFEKFLNEPCYPQQQAFIDQMLGEDPEVWDTKFQEGIAMVGKGGGKDRTISKLLLYVCYKLCCLRDPLAYFENSSIDIVNMSLNAKLAKKVFFKYFTGLIKKCKYPAGPGEKEMDRRNWFVAHGLEFSKHILDREVVFPGGVTCHSLDSTDYSFEGLNVLFVIFDEVGGFIPAKAKEIYDAVTDTQTSRFAEKRKTLLISFPRDPNDFMMIRFQEAETELGTYRVRAATWDWNVRRKKEDFADKYAKNPEAAKRVYECVCDVGEGGYFKYREQLAHILTNKEILNPIVGDFVSVRSLASDKVLFKPFFQADPNAQYFVHVDTAKGKEGGDAAGFCMGHFVPKMMSNISEEYLRKMLALENNDLSAMKNRECMGIKIDLYFQIRAPKGGEIIFDDILAFIVRMKTELKFNIKFVGFDGYQSLSLIQNLKRIGIDSDEVSVDKKNDPYDSLKSVIYSGVLETYPNFIALRECEELLTNDKGKIDHPAESFKRSASPEKDKRGSKDVSDAMAGVVYKILEEIPPDVKLWFSSYTVKGPQNVASDLQRKEQERLVRYGQRPQR